MLPYKGQGGDCKSVDSWCRAEPLHRGSTSVSCCVAWCSVPLSQSILCSLPVPTLCSLACGLKFGILFLGVTSISFNAPAGTPSALAASRMADTFPHVANSVNLAILVESLEAGVNITTAPVRAGHMNVR